MRLHFWEPQGLKAGGRVFDVLVQGKPIVTGLDIAKETRGSGLPLVKEQIGIEATDTLTVELKVSGGGGKPPLLCGLEILSEASQ